MTGEKRVSRPTVDTSDLRVGDRVVFSGKILCGRDAVLPQICALIECGKASEIDVDFSGAAIFHTAVSDAGIGPTSSNKVELEEAFAPLCEAGVKVYLGKGALKKETVDVLSKHGAIFAVVPPVTALLGAGMRSKRLVAYPELGMEALWEVDLDECPAVVAAAHGESLFEGVG